jgi:hypothetical protein
MLNRKNVLLGVREGAVPQKKVRKKSQAFGVPKSAATKAMLATSSSSIEHIDHSPVSNVMLLNRVS